MKLKIPKILETIELKEYALEFGEEVIHVWVNPPREMLKEHSAKVAQKDAVNADIYEWYAQIWSQGAEDTHWSVEEVETLAKECIEKDPRLWEWLVMKTLELIRDHRIKKKVSTP